MRTALLVLVAVLPTAALAQIPAPDAPQRHKSEIFWDSRVTAGASALHVRTVTGTNWSFGGTLDVAGGVTYRGRPNAGLSARAALELSYPNVPSLLTFGFGFSIFPNATQRGFIRATAGPSVVLSATPDVGVGFELDTQWKLTEKLGIAGGLGGYYKRSSGPFVETFVGRATVGVSFDL